MLATKPLYAAAVFACASFHSAVEAASAPKFFEVGKVYTVSTVLATRTIMVLELDRDSVWIRIQTDKPAREVSWLNTEQVIAVQEGAQPPSEAASGIPKVIYSLPNKK